MILYYERCTIPAIDSTYSVIRKSIWKISDPYHILIYIISGKCKINIEEKGYLVNEGDIVYIPANVLYTRTPVDNTLCEMCYIHFSLNGHETVFEDSYAISQTITKNNFLLEKNQNECISLFLPNISHFSNDKERISKNFTTIKQLFNQPEALSFQTANILLFELLSIISQKYINHLINYKIDSEKRQYPDALKKALSYIKNNATKQISLDDLSKASFVSKQMLIRHFNNYLKKSPNFYINEYKINCIKPLLIAYPSLSVREICEEYGFYDQCYFSRVFKKHTGLSPSAYREKIENFNEKKHIENQ